MKVLFIIVSIVGSYFALNEFFAFIEWLISDTDHIGLMYVYKMAFDYTGCQVPIDYFFNVFFPLAFLLIQGFITYVIYETLYLINDKILNL